MMEEVRCEDRWRGWANAASSMFGGLDILTVDAIVDQSGVEQIIEVNGTSSGLHPDNANEDNTDGSMLAYVSERGEGGGGGFNK